MQNVLKLIRTNIRQMVPYSTARDEYKQKEGIFLDANENPFDNGLNRYPDPRQLELKARIGLLKEMPVENIFLGNGSDEAIDLCFRIFCEPGQDNMITVTPTYGMYEVCAAINDIEVRKVPLKSDFTLNPDELLRRVDDRTKLIFICSPNNPSGNSVPLSTIRRIARESGAILVVDEAYIDFAEVTSAKTLLAEFDNIIVLQTLSKAYGMAGLRLGMAFANEAIIRYFSAVKYPYNISGLTQKTVLAQLSASVSEQIKRIKEQRNLLACQLATCSLVRKIYPSEANFLLVEMERADEIYDSLIQQGIIVRNFSQRKGCEGCLRITIGTPEENKTVLNCINRL